MKISDHHVRSPLLNINRACQTCHRWPEAELRARVETIQDRTFEVRNVAMDALMALIADIKAAKARGADDAALETARRHQRRGQFLLDFIEAENSMGFHADQEAVRVLALSLDETRRGQASLPGSVATAGANIKPGSGRSTEIVVPPSGGMSIWIVPPWASTTRFAIGSPRPVPRCFVVKKASNAFSRTSAGIPGPRSATATRQRPSAPAMVTSIRPWQSIACAAFIRMF